MNHEQTTTSMKKSKWRFTVVWTTTTIDSPLTHRCTTPLPLWALRSAKCYGGFYEFLLVQSLLFDLFCVPGFRKSCQYVIQLSINWSLLLVHIFRFFDIIRLMFYEYFGTSDGLCGISRYQFNSNGVWNFNFSGYPLISRQEQCVHLRLPYLLFCITAPWFAWNHQYQRLWKYYCWTIFGCHFPSATSNA